MTQANVSETTPEDILSFWFPDSLIRLDGDDHVAFWTSRMQGGMDAAILDLHADLTRAGAQGLLDAWAETPRGRLALILVLDQFPRSLWRDTPGAFAQDIKATRLALEGLENGHYDALDHPWEKNFYLIAMSHCEGPEHLERMDRVVALAEREVASMTGPVAERYDEMGNQPRRVREIIRRFGRHPHRNAIYGRVSTPDEEVYIAEGVFPHERKIGAQD
ncbi:DUF924 family protein [Marimonas arenosa]|uniref:DUF924 domain-containing protein n=1 Tax=Marimonas arenosa TaxID=1795305 RepID=A0AAE3WCZ8_9RHOB|nr:DUF924 family protein [Marimonas arenosa]MDQ2090444.1 DUF924 domain-containing protein [Marimonas arenosa]